MQFQHAFSLDFDGFMYEHLQLLQTQKKWIQSEIYRWTNRKDMLDACSPSGRKSFMAGQSFEIKQRMTKKQMHTKLQGKKEELEPIKFEFATTR